MWKSLSKLRKRTIIWLGLLQIVFFFMNIFTRVSVTWYICGISFGVYLSLLLDSFGFFTLGSAAPESPDQEVTGDE